MAKDFYYYYLSYSDAQAIKPYLERGLTDNNRAVRESSSRLLQEINLVDDRDYSPLPGHQIVLDKRVDKIFLDAIIEQIGEG